MAAPDVEYFLDMLDVLGFFSQAQNQIVVLCAVKLFRFIGPGGIQQRAAEHGQMGNEVDPAQVVRRKVGLEVLAAKLLQIGGEDNFITVHKICTGVLDGLYNLEQCV